MHRLTVYGPPVNMRLSCDGLYALTRNSMQQDPLSGRLFAFINRRATQIKVLYWGSYRALRMGEATRTRAIAERLECSEDARDGTGPD